MTPRFLQLHTLTGYAATLLNRDDVGRAKRLPFGGTDRVRVSSQCLKRHWREATGEWSLQDLGSGKSIRSRRVFSDLIASRLATAGMDAERICDILHPLRSAVLGESAKAKKKPKKASDDADLLKGLQTDQVIVLGQPEIDFLANRAIDLVRKNPGNPAAEVKAFFKDKKNRDNLKALRVGSGLDAAIFGRMVTSDLMARSDAAIHVAHSFTVHREEAEPDYFSALDDLVAAEGELGSGHINTTELTSGLFYGYVVVDLGKLISNLSGDRNLAGNVLQRLIHLIATVSPGAKLGSTAPYACAELVLAEVGERQPRTLANAFMKAVPNYGSKAADVKTMAASRIGDYLGRYDAMYGKHEARRVATMVEPSPSNAGKRVPLRELADWAASRMAGVA